MDLLLFYLSIHLIVDLVIKYEWKSLRVRRQQREVRDCVSHSRTPAHLRLALPKWILFRLISISLLISPPQHGQMCIPRIRMHDAHPAHNRTREESLAVRWLAGDSHVVHCSGGGEARSDTLQFHCSSGGGRPPSAASTTASHLNTSFTTPSCRYCDYLVPTASHISNT